MGRPRRPKHKLAVVASLVFSLVLGIAIFAIARVYQALVEDACSVTVQQIIPAPNARNALVTFVVSCGATTPFSTQAAIVPASTPFSRENQSPFFVVHGRHELAARWGASDQIEITPPRDEQIYRQDAKVNGVSILYR